MTVNNFVINTMFVERTDTDINLYGANLDHTTGRLMVIRSTKNMENLAQQIFGDIYSNERFIKRLKERPYHNFVGKLSVPISMPFEATKISFVD